MIDEKLNSRVLKALYKTMSQRNWKEQFDKRVAKFQKGQDAVEFTKDFISTEIIEKLIEDCRKFLQRDVTQVEWEAFKNKWL